MRIEYFEDSDTALVEFAAHVLAADDRYVAPVLRRRFELSMERLVAGRSE